MNHHPDFDLPWCDSLLAHRETTITGTPTSDPHQSTNVSNSMFLNTLYHPGGIRAQIDFQRPTSEPDSLTTTEYCFLLSLGTDLDGKTGRAHGGFSALVMDHTTGLVASQVGGNVAPATATLTVDYKATIDTPGVILARGWPVERSGRKVWVRAVIEDGRGRVLASGKALFVSPRVEKM